MDRQCGILLHPTSLPGEYGIGDIGPEAYEFIDSLVEMGQNLWQILPLGPTDIYNSPYSSLSTFAGNHLLISPDLLVNDELLDVSFLDELICDESDQFNNASVKKYSNQWSKLIN